MKKTLQEERQRILEISRKVNESTDSPEESNGSTMEFGRIIATLVSNNIDVVGVKNVVYVLEEVLKSIKMASMQDSPKPTGDITKNLADLGINGLNFELNKAIDSENWELAQKIQKMIERKQGNQRSMGLQEGNAFVGAAKKAKEEGKDSFELNGKTYKVTVSKTEPKGTTNMAIGFGDKK